MYPALDVENNLETSIIRQVWEWKTIFIEGKIDAGFIYGYMIYIWRCRIYIWRVPWTARRSKQSILKEISPEYSLQAEVPILWPPAIKSWLIGTDLDARRDWRQEEKGTTEGEMVGWHHRFNGHEFEQTLRDSEGPGSLGCCSPRGHKESDTTEQLNNNNMFSNERLITDHYPEKNIK